MKEFLNIAKYLKKTAISNEEEDELERLLSQSEPISEPENSDIDELDLLLNQSIDEVPQPEATPKTQEIPETTVPIDEDESNILQEIENIFKEEPKPVVEKPVPMGDIREDILKFMIYMGNTPEQIPETIEDTFKLFANLYKINTKNYKTIEHSLDRLKNSIIAEDKKIPTQSDRFKGLRVARLDLLDKISDFWLNKIQEEEQIELAKKNPKKWKYSWEPSDMSDILSENDVLSKYFFTKIKGLNITPIYKNIDKLDNDSIQNLLNIIESDYAITGNPLDVITEYLDQEPDPITKRLMFLSGKRKEEDPDMWSRVGKKTEEETELLKIKPGQRQNIINQIKEKFADYKKEVGNFFGEDALGKSRKYYEMLNDYASYMLFNMLKFIKNPKNISKLKTGNIISKQLDPKNVFEQMGGEYTEKQIDSFIYNLNANGYINTIKNWMLQILAGQWQNDKIKASLEKALMVNGLDNQIDLFDENDLDVTFQPLLSYLVMLLNKTEDIDVPGGYKPRKEREQKEPKAPKEPKKTKKEKQKEELESLLGKAIIEEPEEQPTEEQPTEEQPTEQTGQTKEPKEPTLEELLGKTAPSPGIAENISAPPVATKDTSKERLSLDNLYRNINKILIPINLSEMIENEDIERKVIRDLKSTFIDFYNALQRAKRQTKTTKSVEDFGVKSPIDLIKLYLRDMGRKAAKTGNKKANEILSIMQMIQENLGLPETFMQDELPELIGE